MKRMVIVKGDNMKKTLTNTSSTSLRQKAEEIQKTKLSKNDHKPSEIDMMRLIQELEIHQIELEMQNEELLQAKDLTKVAIERYSDLYNLAPSGYFTISQKGLIIELNKYGAKMLGKECTYLINKLFALFIPDSEKLIFHQFLESIFSNKTKETCEIFLSIDNLSPVWVLLTGIYTPIDKHCLITMIDISFRKQSELALMESEKKYKALYNAIPDIVFIIDQLSGKIEDVNYKAINHYGYSYSEFLSMLNTDVSAEPEKTIKATESINEMIPLRYHKKKDGSIFPLEITASSFQISNKTKIFAIARDITERLNLENCLKEKHFMLEMAMEAANMVWWEMDVSSGNMNFHNKNIEIFGYTPDKFKHYSDFTALIHSDDLNHSNKAMNSLLSGEVKKYEIEYRILTNSGKFMWFYDIGSISIINSENKPVLVAGLIVNINDRKLAEEKINGLLNEKEFILKEVHHRIKNNMSTIDAILNLQVETLSDKKAISAINDASSRVRSMMVLYDQLYKSVNSQKVSVLEYVPLLIKQIFNNFPHKNSVDLKISIEDFLLDAKKTFYFGIIINELITNIMKYAFINRTKGMINIHLSFKDNLVKLCIQDNGNGIPESIDFTHSPGFGLMLIGLLTNQLEGCIRIERNEGTKIILEFEK